MIAASLLLAFLLSMLSVRLFIRLSVRLGLLDIPNQRSSHVQPTPRGGGIVFVMIWVMAGLLLGLWKDSSSRTTMICSLAVGGIGFLDDRFHLSISLRLFCQIAIALAFSFSTGMQAAAFDFGLFTVQLPAILNIALTSLALVWSINIFNFMDGIDGIAALEGILVLLSGCLFVWNAYGLTFKHTHSMLLLMATLGGFLIWNFPKASVFMGDVGSGFLGFIVIATTLISQVKYQVPIYLFFIVYGVFVVDTSVTIARRMIGGEKWYLPHRVHAYQRLQHVVGWSHKSILAYVGCFNLILFCTAYFAYAKILSPFPAIIIAALTAACYYVGVEVLCFIRRDRRSSEAPS